MPETLSKEEVAALNDALRAALPFHKAGDKFVMTQGIAGLGEEAQFEAMTAVKSFDTFTEDNDPHGEHDFGSFTLSTGDKCFWKIDDYQGQEGINRLLTILLADEY